MEPSRVRDGLRDHRFLASGLRWLGLSLLLAVLALVGAVWQSPSPDALEWTFRSFLDKLRYPIEWNTDLRLPRNVYRSNLNRRTSCLYRSNLNTRLPRLSQRSHVRDLRRRRHHGLGCRRPRHHLQNNRRQTRLDPETLRLDTTTRRNLRRRRHHRLGCRRRRHHPQNNRRRREVEPANLRHVQTTLLGNLRQRQHHRLGCRSRRHHP